MCRQHRRVKVKDYIILNPGAHSFQASEQLHTRSAHSIFAKHQLKMQNESTCHRGKQERDKLGDMQETLGDEQGDKCGDKHSIQQRETIRERSWKTSWEASWETNWRQGRQGLGTADTPSNKGKQRGRQARRQGDRG